MASRAQLFGGGVLVLLGVSGCPVTDDYYIEAGHAPGGSVSGDASTGAQTTAGSSDILGGTSSGGASTGGAAATAGDTASGGSTALPVAGASAELGDGGAGGTPAEPCSPTTERCNGHDDNCNDVIDELSCNSSANGTTGCSGFVLPSNPHHGYMFCATNRKDWSHASDACKAQDMRLAWLESSEENSEVSKKIGALSTDPDVLFGATDAANEGAWFWYGGAQFWQGNENGMPVRGAFNAWGDGTPNDGNDGEDCAVLHPATATWGDRTCSATYAYLCEEPN